jgi:hypothetical protein
MAINIRSIGANQGIINVSLSASVTDSPAKLSVTTLAAGEIAAGGGAFQSNFNQNAQVLNFNGIQFAGTLIGYNRHYEQGKNLITYQYMDNSIYLDQNSIVLFRRGLPSTTTTVGKTLRITRLRISAGSRGVEFRIETRDEYYAVSRFQGTGAGGLGREKFTTNPCEPSDVDYDPNEALNIIGAPNISGGRVSYEGSYRTVLASIYNDVGCYYWWDWRYATARQALKKFNGSISVPEDLPKEGCGILSVDEGWTKEGTYTLSSWLFQRDKSFEAIDGSASTVVHDSFDVSPIPHPNYPSAFDILFDTIPAYRTAYAVWEGNFSLVGLKNYGSIGIPGSPSGDERENLYYKYNFNFNKSLRANILEYLGVGEGGSFYLVKDLENIQKPPKNMELFYPYSNVSDVSRLGSLTDGSLKIKRVEYSPATTRRGLNPIGGTWEDEVGLVRMGLWRSVSTWIEGNSDSSEFDDAVQDCFVGVSHDIFCSLFDNNNGYSWIDLGGGNEKQVVAPGSLRSSIENDGFRIVYVRYPKRGIFPLQAAQRSIARFTNYNDLPDTIGYEDPNAISNEDQEKALEEAAEKDKEYNNPCKSIIKDFDDDTSYDDTESAPLPGLGSALGLANVCSCNGQAVLFVYPSFSKYRVVRRTTAQYSKTIANGNTSPSNIWAKSGGISSTALSHTVNISDITPQETDVQEELYTPESGGTTEPLKTYSATCDGFYLPIVPTLQSLTATVDSAGLLVSYSYKDIPFKPKLQRNLVSAVQTNVSNRMS